MRNYRSGLRREPGLIVRWLFLLAAIVAVWGAVATAETSVVPRPRAVVDAPIHDFGTVPEGTKVRHEFVLRNAGTGPFSIQRIMPSCGCTASNASVDTLSPGAETKIQVTFDTTGFSGERESKVVILTSDPDNGQIEVRLRGRIETDVIFEPAALVFGDVIKGQTEGGSKRVTASVRAGARIVVDDVRSSARGVVITPVLNAPDKRVFDVSLGNDVPLGPLRDRITVVTRAGEETKSVNLPLVAFVRSEVSLRPSSISFGVIEGAAPLVRKATLNNVGAQPIRIVSVTASDPALSAEVKPVDEGRNFVVEVKLDPQRVKANLQATVTVITDRQDVGPVALQVYGILPPGR